MKQENWARIFDLFEQTRQAPAVERRRLLDELGASNPDLRATLERMLVADSETGGLLDRAVPDPDAAAWVEGMLGERVGPYRIEALLGEGGMGVVFSAEQTEPLRRLVAIKLIKLGMDTGEVLRRFAAERDALARMEHPGIARVLDAGATDEGRPYFVMERVVGVPIEAFCDRERLGIRARLDLLMEVCQAVQHAHQRGVIHRDLKPSNILVAHTDQGPRPTVIDFGVAKATDEDRHITRSGRVPGTPEFMSPEQLAGRVVDTRADIFALGVLAHRLVVGVDVSDPGQPGAPRPAAGHAAVRELPSESLRRATNRADLAAKRSQGAGAHLRAVRGELDWIVRKATRSNPDDRYPAVAALAADLDSYLSDRPVSAGAPGAVYRLRKFVRRHQASVAVGVVLAAATVGFAIAMAAQSRRVQAALDEVAAQRDIAAEGLQRANDVQRILTGLFDASDPAMTGRSDASAREALEAGLERVRDRSEIAPDVRAELMATIGRVFRNLGDYPRAEQLLGESLEIAREHLVGDPALPAIAEDLSETLRDVGRWRDAEPIAAEALAARDANPETTPLQRASSLMEVAGVHIYASRDGAAVPLLREVLAIRQTELPASNPLIGDAQNALATAITRAGGDGDEAIALLVAAVEQSRAALPEQSVALGTRLHNLGRALRAGGREAEAIDTLLEAAQLRREVLGDEHRQLAVVLGTLGGVYAAVGAHEDAAAAHRESVEIYRANGGGLDLAVQLGNLAATLARGDDLEAAAAAYEESEAIRRAHGAADDAQSAVLAHNRAGLLRRLDRLEAAQQSSRRAADLARRNFGPDHLNTGIILGRTADLVCLTSVAEGLLLFDESAAALGGLADDHWRWGVHRLLRGRCHMVAGELKAAEEQLLHAHRLLEPRGPANVDFLGTRRSLAELYGRLGQNEKVDEYRTPVVADR